MLGEDGAGLVVGATRAAGAGAGGLDHGGVDKQAERAVGEFDGGVGKRLVGEDRLPEDGHHLLGTFNLPGQE